MAYEKMTEKEKEVISEIKNYLDITYEDEDSDRKLYTIMKNGMERISNISGKELDFTEAGVHKELLLEYCRYGRGNMLEFFERNFRQKIMQLLTEGEIQNYAESGNV